MEAAATVGPTRGVARWAVLGGAVYVVLFVVGVIIFFSGAAGGDDPPAKVIAWYSDSGHRDRVNVGWLIAGLGVFFFLWFLAALRRAVSAVDTEGILTTLVVVGGGIYAALAWSLREYWDLMGVAIRQVSRANRWVQPEAPRGRWSEGRGFGHEIDVAGDGCFVARPSSLSDNR